MKALIIEDNDLIALTLQRNLKQYYQVDVAKTGDDGMRAAFTRQHDVILLDLNLPDISGEEICKRLRAEGVKTPIIVASGRGSVKDKVHMLGIGADDYLVKPFNLEELKMRMQVVLRYADNKAPGGTITIDKLIVDPHGREVTHFGDVIDLRRKEYDLLAYLVYNRDQVLTRNMIMEHIWGTDENLWANVIDVHIKHLRDKVDRPYNTNLIKTVHGVGYKIQSAA